MWQDWVLMVGGFGFSLALLPTILGKSKPATSSSLATFLLLSVFTVVYASLGLWKAVAANELTAIIWGILFIQGRKVKEGGQNTGAPGLQGNPRETTGESKPSSRKPTRTM